MQQTNDNAQALTGNAKGHYVYSVWVILVRKCLQILVYCRPPAPARMVITCSNATHSELPKKGVDNLKTHSVPSPHPKPPKQKTSKNTPEAKQNLPENLHSLKLTWHLKIGHPKRKVVFQPSIFRCYVSFREGIPLQKKNWQNPRHGYESPRACLSQ